MEFNDMNDDMTFNFGDKESSLNKTEEEIINSFDVGDNNEVQKTDKPEEQPKQVEPKEEVKQGTDKTPEVDEEVADPEQHKRELSLNPNDLIGDDGKVLAKAGKERRIFEKGVRFAAEKLSQQEQIYKNKRNYYSSCS